LSEAEAVNVVWRGATWLGFCKFVDRSRFQKFALALLEQGIYISPSAALHSIASLAHSAEEVDITLNAVRKVMNDTT
jgi:glutamate-1-semialdehyde aminotransferase